jgi:hypothetical protein
VAGFRSFSQRRLDGDENGRLGHGTMLLRWLVHLARGVFVTGLIPLPKRRWTRDNGPLETNLLSSAEGRNTFAASRAGSGLERGLFSYQSRQPETV